MLFELCLVSLALTAAVHAETYECEGDEVFSYRFDDHARTWVQRSLEPGLYGVRPLTDGEKRNPKIEALGQGDYAVFYLNSTVTVPVLICRDGRRARPFADDVLYCGGVGHEFLLSTASLRFQHYYAGGYVVDRDNTENPSMIEMGHCSADLAKPDPSGR